MKEREIVIVGGNEFMNALIAYCIERENLATVRRYQSTADIPSTNHDLSNFVILLDNSRDDEMLLNNELAWFGHRLLRLQVAIFNMHHKSPLEHFAAIEGIRGIFYDNDSCSVLTKGLHKIFSHELWFSRRVISTYLLPRRERLNTNPNNASLTDREKQIAKLISAGARNDDIATRLCVSPHTVKTHVYHIFKKIHVKNRVQAARWVDEHMY